MKRILVTGKGSYIGTSFENYVKQFGDAYCIEALDLRKPSWKEKDFSVYDTVFHVAGLAHSDIRRIPEKEKKLYYQINCALAVETAKKAKAEGVKQFIYPSSIIVYGDGAPLQRKQVITLETNPRPSNFYGDSKWKAEQALFLLKNATFHIAVLRLPMIYGKGCRGNFQLLKKLALTLPMFPDYPNERSILYIINLCEFVRLLIDEGSGGLFFPQNSEYARTSEIVKLLAEANGKRIWITSLFNWAVKLLMLMPGPQQKFCQKAFGSVTYDHSMSLYGIQEYQVKNFKESLLGNVYEE